MPLSNVEMCSGECNQDFDPYDLSRCVFCGAGCCSNCTPRCPCQLALDEVSFVGFDYVEEGGRPTLLRSTPGISSTSTSSASAIF